MSENPISHTDESLPPSQPIDSASEALPQIIMVPIADLYIPTWNPRKHMDEGKLKNLMDYRKKGGRVEPILIWYGTGKSPWAVISGQRRTEADRRLGKTHIPAIRMDIPLAEAKILANTSNQNEDMHWWERYAGWMEIGKDHPDWFQTDLGEHLGVSQGTISRAQQIMTAFSAAALEVIYLTQIRADDPFEVPEGVAYALTDLNNRKKVKEAGTGLVERALRVVIDLKLTEPHTKSLVKGVKAGNPPETFGSAPKTPSPKKASGNQASKPKPAPGPSSEALAKAVELAKALGVAEGRGEDTKPAQELLDAHLSEVKAGSTPKKPEVSSDPVLSPKGLSLLKQKIKNFHKAVFKSDTDTKNDPNVGSDQTKPSHHSPKKSKVAHWFEKFGKRIVKHVWHKFVKYEHRACKEIAKEAVPEHYTLHSGHKSSRGFLKALTVLPLTLLHWAVYGVCQFVLVWAVTMGLVSRFAPSLRPLFEWPFRFAARQVLDLPSWAWACATAPGNFWPALATAVVVIWLGTLAYKAEPTRMQILGACLAALLYFGHRWAEQPGPLSQPTVDVNQVVSAPPAETIPVRSAKLESSQLKTSNSKLRTSNSTPVMAYQPSVSFAPPASPSQTLYDPKLLAQEIAALPKNCIVKSFPVLTDEGMPGDLAVSRSQGVTDPDKYTLIIDGDKKIIVNIATTTTNLIINYKSADPLNIDGSGQLNHFWEDVLYIHTDEIEVEGNNPYQFYQLSLVVSGAKHAMTIQCASADDLKHLVSALQYFVRSSRLGHDTALAGMPYPNQGLVLNNNGVVDKLWADSLMDKAAVSLGDHFWSIGKVAFQRQSRTDLEAGLKTLPVTVFVASASEWDRAMKARTNVANSFRPRLRKITLEVGK